MATLADSRYPIGPFRPADDVTRQDLQTAMDDIAALPAELKMAVSDLDDTQLETPYRPEGWTVRQVVHHLADSHMNSYIRFRLALTEDEPTIKPYEEKAWAALADARHAEIEVSLTLLDALHRRWTMLLRSLKDTDWDKTFRHPERGLMRLDTNALLYAWHGKHHLAHINCLRERMRW